jgi:hypothetical protein
LSVKIQRFPDAGAISPYGGGKFPQAIMLSVLFLGAIISGQRTGDQILLSAVLAVLSWRWISIEFIPNTTSKAFWPF